MVLFITGNFTLERHKLRWEDNIKIDLKEIGWEKVDWIQLTQQRYLGQAVVYTVMNFQAPLNAGNFLTTSPASLERFN
jgi:hypothetical protein